MSIDPEFLGSSWDYSIYQTKPTNCLVPLEVIFRWGMPSGSSLKKRINDETYCQELGLTTPVVENTYGVLPSLSLVQNWKTLIVLSATAKLKKLPDLVI